MRYCNDYHQLRKLPSGLLVCEHNPINNFYADVNKKKIADYYELAKNNLTIVANSSPEEQCWTVVNDTELTLSKFCSGIDRKGVYVEIKYKEKKIYPFVYAFRTDVFCKAYRMGDVWNSSSYDKVADFHNRLYKKGKSAAMEMFMNEADCFLRGLEWFVDTRNCPQELFLGGSRYTYNKFEELRIKRIFYILCSIRAILEFDDVFSCARNYIKESLQLLSEFQSPTTLALRRERVRRLLRESESAQYYKDINLGKELEKFICDVDNFIQEYKNYLD